MSLESILRRAIILSSFLSSLAFSENARAEPIKIANVGAYSSPALHDIDNDGDLDLFVGKENGTTSFFRNKGTTTTPEFALETETYADIDAGEYSAPFFCDIDEDGKAELFIGNRDGIILSYKNIGTLQEPQWQATEIFKDIDVGSRSKIAFFDADSDGDLDAAVGEYQGNLNLYENTGTSTFPQFELKNELYAGIDVGSRSAPFFCDLNGKSVLLLGRGDGRISLYELAENGWQKVTDNYNVVDVGETSTITLANINNDGSLDALIGAKNGDILFYNDFAKMLLYIERKYTNSIKLMFESPQGTMHTIYESSNLNDWTEKEALTSTGYNEVVLPINAERAFYKVDSN